jgi:hypothetical protein
MQSLRLYGCVIHLTMCEFHILTNAQVYVEGVQVLKILHVLPLNYLSRIPSTADTVVFAENFSE